MFQDQAASVMGALWSPDETRVLTWNENGTAHIWDAQTGSSLQILAGHTERISGALWSKDARQVLTWSADKTARIWDAQTGRGLQVLEGHTERISGASWSQDERRVLTWSADKTARIWVTSMQLLAAELTNRVCLRFSDQDIQQAIPGWRGCGAELSAVQADLDQYNAFVGAP